jgi:hypothetical protein
MSSSMEKFARLALRYAALFPWGHLHFYQLFNQRYPDFRKFPILNFPHLHEVSSRRFSFYSAYMFFPLFKSFKIGSTRELA